MARLPERLFRKRQPAARLYFDGSCPACVTAANAIAALDWRRRLEFVSFRGPDCPLAPGLTPARLEREMVLAHLDSGRLDGGFSAVRALAGYLPLLWPLRPFLALAGYAGLGDRVYRYLAARRTIIPDPSACGPISVRPGSATAAGPRGRR